MDLGERFTLTGDKREWEVTADNRNQGTKVIEDGAPVTWSNEDSLPVDDFKASAPAATTPTPAAEVSAGVAEAPTGALGLSDSERGFITSDITKLITSDPELLKRDIGRVIKGVVDGWKKKHPTKAVRSVMNAWDAGQKIANYEGFLARKGLETTIPKEVRDAIPFAIEAALAKASGVDTELTHNALEATRGYEAQIDGIKRGYDQLHTLLATVKPDLAYLKGYINRVWENPDAVMAWWNIDAKAKSVRGLARESSHGRQRMIPTLEEGIAGGFIPKVTDVAELYGIYTREVYNSVNDMLVLEAMKGSGDLLPAADAPSGWFKIDLPKAGSMLGESKSGWAVSPELDHTLRVMFEPSRLRQTEGGRAYLLTQSLMKKGSFELSPFHVGALAKSTFAALEAINPFKMIEAKKRYNSGDPIIREMLKAGLEIEAPHDVGRDMYESALSVLGDRVTMLKPIGKAIKAWDIVVWDNAYLTMKVISYEAFRDALYKRYGAKKREGLVGGIKNRLFGELKDPTPKETLNEWAAEAVNAFFGGINNNRYYRTLSQRDEMRAFINSPDWVESVVWRSVTGMWDELYRNADQPFKERVRDAWRKGYSYRRYWTRVGLSFFVIANAINYKTTSADDPDGEGRFIWENPHDERMKVYAGTTDEGEAVYIDLLGFLKDPFEMIVNPVDFAQRKMATLPKTTARMLFNQNWRGDKIYYSTDTDTQSFWKLAKYFVGAGLPISIKNPYEAYAQNKPVWMAIASSFGNPIKIASSKELKARVSDLREEKGNLVFEIKLLMEKGREGKGIMDPKYYEAKQHRLILAFNRKVAKELAELGEQYEMDVFDSEETESDGTNTATPREAFEQFFLYDDKLEESYERWMNGKAVEERQKIITPNAQPSYDEMVSDEATQ